MGLFQLHHAIHSCLHNLSEYRHHSSSSEPWQLVCISETEIQGHIYFLPSHLLIRPCLHPHYKLQSLICFLLPCSYSPLLISPPGSLVSRDTLQCLSSDDSAWTLLCIEPYLMRSTILSIM